MILKIATYNIWNKNFRFDERLAMIINELRVVDADLVALQEVQRDSAGDTAEILAKELGYDYFYFYPDKPKEDKSSGVAILSKLPSRKEHFLRLTRDMYDKGDQGTKVFGAIEVDVAGKRLIFGTTWLSISPTAQKRTTDEISRYLANLENIDDASLIIAGDMNNYADEDILPLFSIGGKQMQDVLSLTYAENIPHTWPTKDEIFIASWQAKHPGEVLDFAIVPRRIDYMLISNDLSLAKTTLFGSNVSSDGLLYASDHVGIYSEVESAA